jgi:hypothetical protein
MKLKKMITKKDLNENGLYKLPDGLAVFCGDIKILGLDFLEFRVINKDKKRKIYYTKEDMIGKVFLP